MSIFSATFPMIWYGFAFVFGLCVGSFLNVCIYRLPAEKSIVRPPSACPACGTPIRMYDNIPVLSYALLRGRCRTCDVHIALRYPLVELLTGVTALGVLHHFGPTAWGAVAFVFCAVLITITFIDVDHRIIPDVISLPGIPVFFLAAVFLLGIPWTEALIGILAGGGSLFLVAFTYYRLTGKEGMGGGDIKLLAMMGPILGWPGVLFTIFVASAVGTVVGIGIMITQRGGLKLAVPFGPFLALGALLHVFYGHELIRWYLQIFR